MEVQGYCRSCRIWFDAHWHKIGRLIACPHCRSIDIVIETDESHDDKSQDDAEEKEYVDDNS